MTFRLLLGLVSVPALIHGLGLRNYGAWAVMLALFNLTGLWHTGLASGFSVYLAAAQSGEGDETDLLGLVRASLGLIALVGAGGSLMFLLLSKFLHEWLLGSFPAVDVVPALRLVALAALLQAVRQWGVALEAGMLRYDLQAGAESAFFALQYGGWVVLAIGGTTITRLAGWLVIASFFGIILHTIVIRKWLLRGIAKDRLGRGFSIKGILRFGLTQSVSQLGITLFSQIDRIVVNIVLGPAPAGLYAALVSLVQPINIVSNAPLQVLAPAIGATDNSTRRSTIFGAAVQVNCLMACILAAAVMSLAELLTRVILPTAEASDVFLLRILALAYGTHAIAAAGFHTAHGLRRPGINARFVLWSGVTFLLALYFLSRAFGLVGAAWANLAYAQVLAINHRVASLVGWPRRAFWLTHSVGVGALSGSFLLNVFANSPGMPLNLRVVAVLVQMVTFAIVLIKMSRSYGTRRVLTPLTLIRESAPMNQSQDGTLDAPGRSRAAPDVGDTPGTH